MHARTATPLTRFHAGMHYFFQIEKPGKFLDLGFVATRRVALDPIIFEQWLAEKHPDDWQRMSMSELIEKNYGPEAKTFVESVLVP